jgi:hypothetical protein
MKQSKHLVPTTCKRRNFPLHLSLLTIHLWCDSSAYNLQHCVYTKIAFFPFEKDSHTRSIDDDGRHQDMKQSHKRLLPETFHSYAFVSLSLTRSLAPLSQLRCEARRKNKGSMKNGITYISTCFMVRNKISLIWHRIWSIFCASNIIHSVIELPDAD